MTTDNKGVIHVRLRSDIPYERRLQRALRDLPHGYVKRVIVQLLRYVLSETVTTMSREQVRQLLIDIADNGVRAAPSPDGSLLPALRSTQNDDGQPREEPKTQGRTSSAETRGNALPSLISSRVSEWCGGDPT